MSDDEFDALPVTLRHKIDSAFDEVIKKQSAEQASEEEADSNATDAGNVLGSEPGGFITPAANEPGGFITDEPGGFMVEDSEQQEGGFVLEQEPEPGVSKRGKQTRRRLHIPLSLIPRALSALELPDDDEVLQVFRNAASGWTADQGSSVEAGRGRKHQGEQVVSREDWRAVCAALLAASDEDLDQADVKSHEETANQEVEGDSDLTPYSEEEDAEDDDYSDDDFSPTKASNSRKGRTHNVGQRSSSPSRTDMPTRAKRKRQSSLSDLTSRQKEAVLLTFSLFFEPNTEVENRRLGVKDIQRVAKDLKEKLGLDEINEMLQEFSSAPDKSMGLEEFGKMMTDAGLV
ncbi:hypothetical protein OE88DRAFT_1737091 [Heliocybe sulcata]|uniref:EF-hand domain-containing protein n=1 Tax=Heliocybe sulcata TaxID=5364 RepID=A0A5C3MVG8_9AGAM|nr:hypothetical protein OE88DRAFT_1737091 [Heliocybe sulcata]